MMRTLLSSLSACLLMLLAPAAHAGPAYPPHAIANSLLRTLPINADGRRYQLHIHLPASFAQQPERRYPVLYLTDGYWDFPTVVASYDNLVYDKVLPEFIIVGLGYAGDKLDYGQLRGWELSPVPLDDEKPAGSTGHADRFLAALVRDIIPFMEREYGADAAHRYLAGSSLGGLFTLYAMYTRPELFEGYIAASPAVVVGNDWIIGQAKAYAATGKPLKARLYVTGAEYEWPHFLAGIQRYQALLPELKHPAWSGRAASSTASATQAPRPRATRAACASSSSRWRRRRDRRKTDGLMDQRVRRYSRTAVLIAARSIDASSRSSSGECAPLPVAPRPSRLST